MAFESGKYDYAPASNTDIYVPQDVTLQPAPGDTTRPLIKQTVAYTTCSCPMFGVDGTIDGLDIDQAVVTAGHAAGAACYSFLN